MRGTECFNGQPDEYLPNILRHGDSHEAITNPHELWSVSFECAQEFILISRCDLNRTLSAVRLHKVHLQTVQHRAIYPQASRDGKNLNNRVQSDPGRMKITQIAVESRIKVEF